MTYSNLFAGTAIGFGVSAVLVLSALLPTVLSVRPKPFLQRLTVGFRLFALTPRLRGLLAISLATAAGGAMIFVNTVVIVQTRLELGPEATAWALAAFGAGSMFAAFFVPRLLDYMSDRWLVIAGGAMMFAGLLAGAFHHHGGYTDLLVLWFNIGVGYSFTVTPAGRALRRSAAPVDRPALFAAHFALSHGCWLVAYPVAGLIGATWGIPAAFSVLAALCGLGSLGAWLFWPSEDPEVIPHDHSDLPPDHPHLREHGIDHVHPYVIDDLHPRWK
jgi:predicted MFS family arabinose efflux permease